MTDRILHCWHGENDDNEIGSDEWLDIFIRGEGTCLLPDGHDGPHVYTPDDGFVIVFAREPVAESEEKMDWEIYFKNPTSQFDQFVDEEKTIVRADTKEGACTIVHANLLGQFGRITKVYNLTPGPVADGMSRKENNMKRCGATIIVKDECAILPFRCERENGHSRQHLIHYPGQWGEVKIPVEWMGNDRQEVEFYRNLMLDEPVAERRDMDTSEQIAEIIEIVRCVHHYMPDNFPILKYDTTLKAVTALFEWYKSDRDYIQREWNKDKQRLRQARVQRDALLKQCRQCP